MRHRISFVLRGKGNTTAVLDYRTVRITIAALLTGLMIGAVGGAFRLLLGKADDLRDALVVWAHAWPHLGWLAPVALGTLGAAVARLMVARFAPEAEGSGIQRLEALYADEIKPGSPSINLAVKFFGGLLSIGSGLALGREGPTVQMGAALSALASRWMVKDNEDRRVIGAAGAGAGLAVAFNAPIGGSVFVFEELTSTFTPWLLVATLAATTFAVWTMRLILGNHFDFTVRQVSLTAVWKGWPFFVLGVLLGAGGALYNSAIIGLLRLCDRFVRISSVLRAAFIGAVVGLLAWFAPAMVGQSDASNADAALPHCRSGRNLPSALCHRSVVVCRRLPRRTLCADAGGRGLLRRLFWRSAEPLTARAGCDSFCLCCGRHGDAIYRLCARTAHRHCAGGRDDRTWRSHAPAPFSFADGDVDNHAAGQRTDL